MDKIQDVVDTMYQLASPKPLELSIADTKISAIFSFISINAAKKVV